MMDSRALAARYARTEAGRAEIQRRAVPLTRAGRNLLLTIDASRTGEGWLLQVRGAAASDLHALIAGGLVAEQDQAPPRPDTPPPVGLAPPPAAPRMSLAQALQTKGKDVLCRRVLAESRSRLGMVRGYMLALEVDYCVSDDDIRALAQKFVEQVRERDGDQAAIALAQILIAPD